MINIVFWILVILTCSNVTFTNDVKQGHYKHFRTGKLYYVEGVARFSEDPHNEFVVYRSMYESKLEPEGIDLPSGTLWIRSKEMFIEKVKNKEGNLVSRFAYVDDKNQKLECPT